MEEIYTRVLLNKLMKEFVLTGLWDWEQYFQDINSNNSFVVFWSSTSRTKGKVPPEDTQMLKSVFHIQIFSVTLIKMNVPLSPLFFVTRKTAMLFLKGAAIREVTLILSVIILIIAYLYH